ncbi:MULTISPECIES: archease [Myxococcus]|uniref:Archease domain-containing protein n=1 Tax=Myxococcus xanthus TaxID=34 RepID=A0AAE6G3J5_MYXXA|nr:MULTISPECIES: archease [Myxococcus]QDE70348.1 hypothetical protein BHS09_27140 [Myxococcus xanthus]QDE77627.1 hypothetical protein BHS08_27160 [Myxococcus xanthus]QDE85013.1 hypothetical protein BHS07_27700 [Myxococcus xanthus]QDE99169.1 hypothetical protein BHS05_26950 [Myxococcus xanthus]QDF06856.1 hypothetical protein BHS04_27250 [Myxococcus xanthus]
MLSSDGGISTSGAGRRRSWSQLRISGTGLPELFEEAGYALAAADTEALLVDWLNELIARSDLTKRVYTDLVVDALQERSLRAHIRGVSPPVLKTAVKAATFHGLELHEHDDGFTATVVLDV